ncbi:MAG: AraC family transcriptional regulator [Oscillospiraceae bacterium]|nr:AraC family transcriptional regulator [Oscillospiraceae bacterium]
MTFPDRNKKDKMIQLSFVTQLKFPYPFIVRKVCYSSYFLSSCHYHDCAQIWYCKKGSYRHITEACEYVCTAGTFVIIPPGKYHSFIVSGDEDVELVAIDFSCDAFLGFCNGKYTNIIAYTSLPGISSEDINLREVVTLDEKHIPYAEEILEKLSSSLPNKAVEKPENILRQLEKIFSLPEIALGSEYKKKADGLIHSRLLPILKAVSFINSNYSKKNISEELATVSTLCRTNFFKYFHKYMGITYSTYLTMLRVGRATYALVYTDYSISYISDICGFASCSHLGIYYKKYKGLLPKEDRAACKETKKQQPYIHISHYSFD